MLLGSGELGKELVIAAKRAGLYVVACDRYDNAPAMQVADERDIFSMLDGDALAAAVARHNPDIIVPEIEAIRTERLFDFEAQGIPTRHTRPGIKRAGAAHRQILLRQDL